MARPSCWRSRARIRKPQASTGGIRTWPSRWTPDRSWRYLNGDGSARSFAKDLPSLRCPMTKITKLQVNGTAYPIDADADVSLLSVLRNQLDLTGSKYGCGEGQCGACTVLINGNPRRACITPVGAAAQKQITTIEGLETEGRLHPLQEAFLAEGAMQCAFCTSGMILTAVSLLNTNHNPSAEQITEFMNGNICRCGTYPRSEGAMQCAFCTSGMILTAVSLLNTNHNPSAEQITEFMNGNICRCGTYP